MAGTLLPLTSVLGGRLPFIVFTCVWSDVSFTYSNDHHSDDQLLPFLLSCCISIIRKQFVALSLQKGKMSGWLHLIFEKTGLEKKRQKQLSPVT